MAALTNLYRISDSSNLKEKPSYATKRKCLENFLEHFGEASTEIFADNVSDETYNWLLSYGIETTRTNSQIGNTQSFRLLLERALELPPQNYIYFIEDDYLHRKNSKDILIEGLMLAADYISLYDHPDKYDPSGNPEGATEVILTNSSHWKHTNSTTFCFATQVWKLLEDKEIFLQATEGSLCQDFWTFQSLRQRGRTIATPIPSLSTHCENKYLSPLIDWSLV